MMWSIEKYWFYKVVRFFSCILFDLLCLNSVYSCASENLRDNSADYCCFCRCCRLFHRLFDFPSCCCLCCRWFIGFASSLSIRTQALWLKANSSFNSVSWEEYANHQHGVSFPTNTRMSALCPMVPVLPVVLIMPTLNTTSWWIFMAFTTVHPSAQLWVHSVRYVLIKHIRLCQESTETTHGFIEDALSTAHHSRFIDGKLIICYLPVFVSKISIISGSSRLMGKLPTPYLLILGCQP